MQPRNKKDGMGGSGSKCKKDTVSGECGIVVNVASAAESGSSEQNDSDVSADDSKRFTLQDVLQYNSPIVMSDGCYSSNGQAMCQTVVPVYMHMAIESNLPDQPLQRTAGNVSAPPAVAVMYIC